MAFLFASPRVFRINHPPYEEVCEPVEFLAQYANVCEQMSDAAKSINHRYKVATLASLRESLEDGVKIIHIACHDEKDEYLKSKMGEVQYAAYLNKGNYLIFEDQIGCSKPLTVSDLAGLLS